MRKLTRSITLSAALGALGACSSVQHLETPYLPSKLGSQNQNQIDYDLHLTNLAGSLYGIEKGKIVKPNEWGFEGTALGGALDSSRVKESRGAGKLSLESKTDSVIIGVQWSKDGKVVDEIRFDTEGDLALKAEVNLPKINSYAGGVTLTPKNLKYHIPTTDILVDRKTGKELGRTYSIDLKNTAGDVIGTLVSPVDEDSELLFDLDGTTFLRNPGNIYLLTKVSRVEFNRQREEYLNTIKGVEEAQKRAKEDLERRNQGIRRPSVTVPAKEEKKEPEKAGPPAPPAPTDPPR